MKWKQVLVVGLVGAALLTGGVTAGAFSDTPPAWSAAQLTHLEENGILEGLNTGDATTAPIRRGDFCQLLVNLVQKEMTPSSFAAVPAKESSYFTDIADTVNQYNLGGKNGMYYAAAYGITEGALVNGQRRADTDALLTREQAAKMMCSAVDFLEQSVLEGSVAQRGTAKTFTDAASVSAWASTYVDQASALGIMEGDEMGRFNPKGAITWNEAAVMVDRAFTSATALRSEQLAGAGMTLLQSQAPVMATSSVYLENTPPVADPRRRRRLCRGLRGGGPAQGGDLLRGRRLSGYPYPARRVVHIWRLLCGRGRLLRRLRPGEQGGE